MFTAIIGFLISRKIIGKLIQNGLKSELVMKSSNVDKWGEIPGKYNLQMIRNISFFNWKNPENFKNNGEKPIFQRVESVLLQELNQISDIKADSKAAEISYNLTYNLTAFKGRKKMVLVLMTKKLQSLICTLLVCGIHLKI